MVNKPRNCLRLLRQRTGNIQKINEEKSAARHVPYNQRYMKTTCRHWGARGFCIVLVVNALLGSALVMYGEQEKCKEVYRSIRKSETPNYFRSFAFSLYICKVTQNKTP